MLGQTIKVARSGLYLLIGLSLGCQPYGSSVTNDTAAASDTITAVEDHDDAIVSVEDSVFVPDRLVTETSEDTALPQEDSVPVVDSSATDALTDAGMEDSGSLDVAEIMADGLECPEGALCELPYNYSCKEGRCNAQGLCVATPIPNCCYYKTDCEDIPLGPCEEIQCVSKECTAIKTPGCCLSDGDCVTPLQCAVSTCNLETSQCEQCPGDCPCGSNNNVVAKSFDKPTLGANGLSQTDYGSNDDVRWQVDSYRTLSPPNALYLGDPNCRTYYNGLLSADCEPVTAGQDATSIRIALYSPVLNLANSDGSAGSAIIFWYWSDVEPDLGLGPAEPDVLRFFIDHLDGTGLKWSSGSILDSGKNTNGTWLPIAIDLAPYTGKMFRLRMEFDTVDGQLNDHEGIYLDDFQVVDKCPDGCCDTDLDCPYSGDPCLKPVCLPFSTGSGSICTEAPIGGPCEPCTFDNDCEDENPCTNNVCTEAGICALDVFCCYAQTIFSAGFENALVPWTVADPDPTDAVVWQASQTTATEGLSSAWFGDVQTGTYEGLGPVKGTMVSPPMELPTEFADGGELTLDFDLLLDTEWDGLFYLNPIGIDRLTIELLGDGSPKEIWSSDDIGGTTQGAWIAQTVALTPWAGKTVQLRITFDSGDENANAYGGPRLDNLKVGRTCP
jgi:hypothetical protein